MDAGSRAYTGEGLVGLSWAFLRAGAHNVIGALWEVSDVSTPELMEQMYQEIGEGRPPESALRDAKLTLFARQRISQAVLLGAVPALYRVVEIVRTPNQLKGICIDEMHSAGFDRLRRARCSPPIQVWRRAARS